MSPKIQPRFLHWAAMLAPVLVRLAASGQTCELYVATDGNAGTLSNPWRYIQERTYIISVVRDL